LSLRSNFIVFCFLWLLDKNKQKLHISHHQFLLLCFQDLFNETVLCLLSKIP
jgi:hypothetical protein